jgi:predicted dehydrogenase
MEKRPTRAATAMNGNKYPSSTEVAKLAGAFQSAVSRTATGDLGSDHIDVARFMVGEIVEIGAFTETITKDLSGKEDGINDHSFVAIAKLANGALATFDASRVAGGHALTGKIEVDGTLGSISFDMER